MDTRLIAPGVRGCNPTQERQSQLDAVGGDFKQPSSNFEQGTFSSSTLWGENPTCRSEWALSRACIQMVKVKVSVEGSFQPSDTTPVETVNPAEGH